MPILVCGIAEEEPVSLLLDALQRKKADYILINQTELAQTVQMRWQLSDKGVQGCIRVKDTVIDLTEVSSVYHRFVDVEMIDFDFETVKQNRTIIYNLMNLFDLLPVKIVNRRRPMMSNNSKPYQAMLIREAGFLIPETLITNEPQALEQYSATNGPLIYKSISSVRSIVASYDNDCRGKLAKLRLLPTQFQKRIEGFNLRVHVVGKKVYATRISGEATDYRYAAKEGVSVKFLPIPLNTELRRKCIDVTRRLGLLFAGIDLMVGEAGVYCLEVNPAPGYSYYQNATGQPIADALAELLMDKR